ncbi:MAG: hypothetical protein ISF22_09920 [Methanomassiliicoccus sp.]|nr:hypothetical protein [Methanomassiliicoccus sp.]
MTTYTPPPAQYTPAYPVQPRKRPLGVTILAILEILGGLLLLLAAFGMFAIAALTGTQEFIDALGPNVPQWLLDSGPVLFGVAGVVLLIMAVVAFLLAWGFLKGKRWAWILGIIFSVLNIASSVVTAVFSGSLASIATLGLSILIPVLILVYLLLPSTKTWFTE